MSGDSSSKEASKSTVSAIEEHAPITGKKNKPRFPWTEDQRTYMRALVDPYRKLPNNERDSWSKTKADELVEKWSFENAGDARAVRSNYSCKRTHSYLQVRISAFADFSGTLPAERTSTKPQSSNSNAVALRMVPIFGLATLHMPNS